MCWIQRIQLSRGLIRLSSSVAAARTRDPSAPMTDKASHVTFSQVRASTLKQSPAPEGPEQHQPIARQWARHSDHQLLDRALIAECLRNVFTISRYEIATSRAVPSLAQLVDREQRPLRDLHVSTRAWRERCGVCESIWPRLWRRASPPTRRHRTASVGRRLARIVNCPSMTSRGARPQCADESPLDAKWELGS